MKLICIPSGPIETNAWLIINETNRSAILFDAPPASFSLIKKELDSCNCLLKALFLTHGHWDHMLDSYLFAEADIPVYAHQDSIPFMEHPEEMSDYAMPGLTWKGCTITNPVKNGDTLEIEGMKLEIRTAPGHCPGSIIAYLGDMETAITGDVIFNGSIGRTDLPGGSFEVLQENIRKQIYSLPDNTILCPGHGDKTSVEKEKKTNPFVREAG